MFKSTSEFEKAMYDILVKFRDGMTNPNEFGLDLDQQDFDDAFKKVIDQNFVSGIHVRKTFGGPFYSLMNPRITYDGLSFIERFEQKQK